MNCSPFNTDVGVSTKDSLGQGPSAANRKQGAPQKAERLSLVCLLMADITTQEAFSSLWRAAAVRDLQLFPD